MTKLRLIGDVHGHYDQYVTLAKAADRTIQLGDLGFDYDCLKELDPERHKVLAGNHDNYDNWGTSGFIHMRTGHWLGDFGVYEVPDFGPIFFVRGGYSIDWQYRVEGRTWWKDEELAYEKMQEALQLYIDTKPEFVISHECPGSIVDPIFGQKIWDGVLLKPSMTAKLLDQMWSNHSPKWWLFGHHHREEFVELNSTKFRCIPELGFVDFDENKEIVYAESPQRRF